MSLIKTNGVCVCMWKHSKRYIQQIGSISLSLTDEDVFNWYGCALSNSLFFIIDLAWLLGFYSSLLSLSFPNRWFFFLLIMSIASLSLRRVSHESTFSLTHFQPNTLFNRNSVRFANVISDVSNWCRMIVIQSSSIWIMRKSIRELFKPISEETRSKYLVGRSRGIGA